MTGPWYVEAFRSAYLGVYPHRDLEAARREAKFLVDQGARGRLLDVCCGFGRHCAALRDHGIRAYGLDLSLELLGRAGSLAPVLEGRLACGDARRLPFADACADTVVSLFSSFGYFGEEGDRRVLLEVGRVLRPGGLFVLDLMNPAQVRSTLVPLSRIEREGIGIEERRKLADGGRRVQKEVRLRARDGTQSAWTEDVRLYEAVELEPWLLGAGLALNAAYGGFDGSTLAPDSPRQILRARRR